MHGLHKGIRNRLCSLRNLPGASAQFRERVAQFEAQAAEARAAGDARRAQQADAQAEQWREWLATAEQAVQHR